MRAVAALPASALIAGAAIELATAVERPAMAAALLAACAVAAVWAWMRARAAALAVSVAVGFFAGGAALASQAWRDAWAPPLRQAFDDLARRERQAAEREGRRLPLDDQAAAIVEGRLRRDASATPSGVSLLIDVDSIAPLPSAPGEQPRTVSGGISVTVAGSIAAERLPDWRAGRRIRLPAALHRPARYLDPGVPDFERATARRGVVLMGSAKSGALVDLVSRGSPVDEALAALRARLRRAIAAAVGRFSPRSAAVVAAIVIGDRAGLDRDTVERLQQAGTFHVIAISGAHVAILTGVVLGLFKIAGLFGRAALLAALVVLLAYARLVGGSASVERATVMAAVYLGARLLDHRSESINTLAFVAACLVAVQPLSVVDPAFILTFGATLALVAVAPVVRLWILPPRLSGAGPVPRLLGVAASAVAGMAASAATEALLLPVGAIVFSRITFAGLLLNLAAIPLTAVVEVSGMLLAAAALVSAHAAIGLGYIAHLAATGLIESAALVRLAPWLTFRVAPPAAWVVAAYYVGLAAALCCRGRAMRRAALAAAVGSGVWIAAQPWRAAVSKGDGRLHVTFLDVGQGDAAFIRFPKGQAMLVDTGGLVGSTVFDIGERVVAPVLRQAGVGRLDALVLTHGDPDHIGGAVSVVREFRPRRIWEGVPVPRFEPLRLVRAEADAAGAAWTNVHAGDDWSVDDVLVRVVHPDPPQWERQRVRNDDSIVIELVWKRVSVLLTGDIGAPVEPAILARTTPAAIRILKVPHHGSLTSSSAPFVGGLAPAVAVVSAGRANHFGHPAPEILDRYRRAGAAVFRTDSDGAVAVETDGESVSLATFAGRRVDVP